MVDMMFWMRGMLLYVIFGLVWMAVAGKQWRDPIISPKRACLAQARWAEARPDFLREGSLRRLAQFWASECLGQTRGVSPKREYVEAVVVCVSSSRLGGGSLPERESFSLERDPLA